MSDEEVKEKPFCHKCGHIFDLGDKIYLLRIWILGRSLCLICKDKVVAFIDTSPKNPPLKPITHMTI